MSEKLKGKVAVVTGASKGIGASIAEHLAAEGASVVVNYAASKTGADSVVRRISEKGGTAVAVQADVSRPDDIKRLFAQTRATYGRLGVQRDQGGRGRRDDRALERARPEKDPGEFPEPGHGGNRGASCRGHRRKRLPQNGGIADAARPHRQTGRHRPGRRVLRLR